jgi:hypothetical protein
MEFVMVKEFPTVMAAQNVQDFERRIKIAWARNTVQIICKWSLLLCQQQHMDLDCVFMTKLMVVAFLATTMVSALTDSLLGRYSA